MIDLQLKITPRLLRQVAAIERLSGRLEKMPLNSDPDNTERDRAIRNGCVAALRLDATASPLDSHSSERTSAGSSAAFEALLAAHAASFELDPSGIIDLYGRISGTRVTTDGDSPDMSLLRRQAAPFCAPALGKDEIVFTTLQPFLVPQRFVEITEWIQHELEQGTHHPLILIGVHHLLFLQTSPFPTANHRVALVLTWHLLNDHGFSFVALRHFAPYLEELSKQYFSALRQTEKTALTNWATFSAWLELFFQTLETASEDLAESAEGRLERLRLTTVQKRIVETVRTEGPVTREKIADVTGINISTIKYNLGVLSSRGLLHRLGGGRTTSYTLLSDRPLRDRAQTAS